MRTFWKDFKSFALGGNMFDLALGFIIGTAFAALVESLASNVIMQFVAALFGKPDFSNLSLTVNGAEIKYGAFLTDLVSFLLLAVVLFALVRILIRYKMGNFKAQGTVECEYCKEFVAVDATKCKWCTADLVPVVRDDE
ncbi:large conductance mechanosensitive channel protein MscL [Smaragdicoccus niigatensis]|uniref:large conductance mechanosensitive channel protein MscL n=1 Tax=Smaragdicoccus niigatensis TaxID=359359 RepID=UPI0003810451|nr:large conductance mechanosensitive channel protein MscL [Smaragdicoccus niigatensis]